MRFLESLTQLCLALWVGGMGGFAMTAPLIFDAFGPERQRAGDLAGNMIWRLNMVGIILGVVVLLILLPRLRRGIAKLRALLTAGALAMALVQAFYIFPQMDRAQPPQPIETYAETDPVRVEYNRWHTRSEQVFGTTMLLAAGALLLGPFEKREGR
ncbi:MAG TPA: DUF4149 domain-containing protein [Symbiobacteriaceae bacterium]